jgi:intracellular multiplication protein IcmP
MRGGGQQGGNAASSASMNFFWYTLTAMVALMLVWYFFQPYLTAIILSIRSYEILLLKMIASVWNPLVGFLHLTFLKINTNVLALLDELVLTKQLQFGLVSFHEIQQISYGVGIYLRYLVVCILAVLSTYLFYFHKKSRYRKIYSMKSLRNVVHKNWPEITPIMDLNLVKQSLMKGPWSMAQTPLEFCKEHQLLSTKVNAEGKTIWHLLRAPSHRLFVLQLGPLWNGNPFKQPIHIQALMVIFIACAQKERPVANRLLDQIASSAREKGQLDFSGVSELMAKYARSKGLIWAMKRHAYVATMLATLLEIARTDGVLATSEFLWLKPVDRRLWYMLNSVGRQTAFVEVSGLFAHWLAEKSFKCPLKTPMVREAVVGLQHAIDNTLYISEHEKAWQYDANDAG